MVFDISPYFILSSPNCESLQLSNEYISAYTSLLYVLLSLLTFIISHVDFIHWGRVINSLFCIVGISKFLYYLTLYKIYENVSSVAILLLSYFSAVVFIEIVTLCYLTPPLWRYKVTAVYQSIVLLIYTIVQSAWLLSKDKIEFIVYCTLPQIISFISICFINYHFYFYVKSSNFMSNRAIRYLNIGCLLLICSSIIPIYIEPLCTSDATSWARSFKYSNVIWHIISSYAIHLIFHSLGFINLLIKGKPCGFHGADSTFFLIFPCTVTKLNIEEINICICVAIDSLVLDSPDDAYIIQNL